MPVDDTPEHHDSHRPLLRAPGPQPGKREIDAIIVPTTRRPAYLAVAARLAQELGSTLVTLHSKEWTSAAKAVPRLQTPDLAALNPLDLIAIDVPDPAHLRLPRWETSGLLAGTAFAQSNSDLSAKRNLGLMLSRMLGWSRVLFLDDDITEVKAADIQQASGLLDTYNAVGLHVGGFPDNSVVCHAYRQAGGGQQSFIGGGALVVRVERCSSFFPEIYNDDWFFLLDGDKGLQSVAVTGKVRQYPYDPFRTPARARAEELGDVLAEGIYWLLDQDRTIRDANRKHWAQFLDVRKNFIERVLEMVRNVPLKDLEHNERQRRIAALKGSLGRLALITPELCERYLLAWANDHETWQRHVQALPAFKHPQAPEQRAKALALLSRKGSPRLNWRLGGGVPAAPAAASAPAAPAAINRDEQQPRVSQLLPALSPAGADAAHQEPCMTGVGR